MMIPSLRTGLAALAALGGLAAAAHAQPLPAPQPPAPQVIKWPGGYMVMNGSEVIVRSSGPAGSTSVVTGSGNGFGNRIVVDGGPGGVTVVKNSRNGIGNRVIANPDDLFIDLDELVFGVKPACPKPAPVGPMVQPQPVPAPADPVIPPADPLPPAVNPAPVLPVPAPADPNAAPAAGPVYKGKASPFWTSKVFSDAYDCNLYWCPTTKLWFRYHGEDDAYRPVPAQPLAPVDAK